jgi:2-oxoglutarate ferredoxin oxidoreductase subunit alpha
MNEYSILIGGKAGDGISQAGQIIGSIFSSLGYHVYQYVDYPSLIRGGHNFCIIRAAKEPIFTHRTKVNVIIAFDQQTVDTHLDKLANHGIILFDKDKVKTEGVGISITQIINELQGIPIMGNTAMIAVLFRYLGVPWEHVESVLSRKIPKKIEKNLQIAQAAWKTVTPGLNFSPISRETKPFLSGNEWIAIGLLAGGIDAYIAYPMTPSSGVLHFLASVAEETGITVYHPESEIAVILMALGFSYTGKKSAVGTSGGGFCLMTEGLSLAGQAELPIVIIVSQRTGPSTGLPTYTAQSDLMFIRHAGQGEFPDG